MDAIAKLRLYMNLFTGMVYLLLLGSCYAERKINGRLGRSYSAILWVALSRSVVSAGFIAAAGLNELFRLREAAMYILCFGNFYLTAVYSYYLRETLQPRQKLFRLLPRINLYTATVCAVVVLTLRDTGLVFIMENGTYLRGPYWSALLLFPAISSLLNTVVVLFWKIGLRQKLSLLCFCVLPLLGTVFNDQYGGIAVAQLAELLAALVLYTNSYLVKTRQIVQAEAKLTQSRIAIMISQIQPHFLFNSLTAIRALCLTEPMKAREAISDFSDYLRENLAALTESEPIPFYREAEHTRLYLRFELLRFEGKLDVQWDLQTEDFRLPPLTVQPLVENAVKHGLGYKEEGGTVEIHTEEDADFWKIRIRDNGAGFDPSKVLSAEKDETSAGGLANVRSRLRMLMQAEMDVESAPGKGTTIWISIPKGETK